MPVLSSGSKELRTPRVKIETVRQGGLNRGRCSLTGDAHLRPAASPEGHDHDCGRGAIRILNWVRLCKWAASDDWCVMNDDASSGTSTGLYRATVLGDADAGEIMTLQRAAYVTEAQAHNDLHLPPLTQGLDELRAELGGSNVVALGVREEGRLIAAVRLRRIGSTVELGRLTVAPDRQGKGIGSFLLGEAEKAFPEAREMQLFTGERSSANIRLYERSGYVETGRTPVGDYSIVHLAKMFPHARAASRS